MGGRLRFIAGKTINKYTANPETITENIISLADCNKVSQGIQVRDPTNTHMTIPHFHAFTFFFKPENSEVRNPILLMSPNA